MGVSDFPVGPTVNRVAAYRNAVVNVTLHALNIIAVYISNTKFIQKNLF